MKTHPGDCGKPLQHTTAGRTPCPALPLTRSHRASLRPTTPLRKGRVARATRDRARRAVQCAVHSSHCSPRLPRPSWTGTPKTSSWSATQAGRTQRCAWTRSVDRLTPLARCTRFECCTATSAQPQVATLSSGREPKMSGVTRQPGTGCPSRCDVARAGRACSGGSSRVAGGRAILLVTALAS